MSIENAMLFCQNEDYDSALNCCHEVFKTDPNNADAWFIAGLAYTNLFKMREAYIAFDNASQFATRPENKAHARANRDAIGM